MKTDDEIARLKQKLRTQAQRHRRQRDSLRLQKAELLANIRWVAGATRFARSVEWHDHGKEVLTAIYARIGHL
jgi:hypothetical protein